MDQIVASKRSELQILCARYRVRRLALFASAAIGELDADRSDLGFAVESEPMSPKEHANAFY